MARKPRVSPLVPTFAIDRRLGNVHVLTPDAEVAAMITTAPGIATDPRWTPTLIRQSVRYALWRHNENLAQALAVGLR